MTLEQLQTEWAENCKLDNSELDAEVRRIPMLHAKYLQYWNTERLKFKKTEMSYAALYRQRYEWYNGRLDDVERKALGWPVQPLKILSPNLPIYLQADPLLQELQQKKEYQAELCKAIEEILKQINSRGFQCNTILGFLKWKSGV